MLDFKSNVLTRLSKNEIKKRVLSLVIVSQKSVTKN